MILTCPSCATSYFAPDDAIGSTGRTVRCQACGNSWRATLDEPLELTAAYPAAVPTAAAAPVEAEPAESLAETPASELPGAFRARAEQQRRLRRAAAHGAVWAGLASVFVGLLGAAWLFRVEVVELAPRTAAAYAAVGMPVNRTGLEFEALTARAAPNDPGQVLISGALRNIRDREIAAPPVRVALLDGHGAEIGHAVVRIDAAPVLPGAVQGFAVLIPDPGAHGEGIGVDFAMDAPRAAPRQDHAEPAHRPLPGPAEPHLRPASAPLKATAPVMHPLDAVPEGAPALDSHPAEAVSAPDHG